MDNSDYNEIFGTGTLANQGTVVVPDADGRFYNTLTIDPAAFNNGGLVTIGTDGVLLFGAHTAFTNPGMVELANGASLAVWLDADLAGVSQAGGSIVDNGGTVLLGLNGTIDNTGSTFDLGQANGVSVTGFAGLLEGGTILPDGGTIVFRRGTLDGVTYAGALQPTAGSTLYVENGLTVTAPEGGTPLIDLSGTIGTSDIASFDFLPVPT